MTEKEKVRDLTDAGFKVGDIIQVTSTKDKKDDGTYKVIKLNEESITVVLINKEEVMKDFTKFNIAKTALLLQCKSCMDKQDYGVAESLIVEMAKEVKDGFAKLEKVRLFVHSEGIDCRKHIWLKGDPAMAYQFPGGKE